MATAPTPSQTLPPTGEQVVRHRSPWETFSLKPHHEIRETQHLMLCIGRKYKWEALWLPSVARWVRSTKDPVSRKADGVPKWIPEVALYPEQIKCILEVALYPEQIFFQFKACILMGLFLSSLRIPFASESTRNVKGIHKQFLNLVTDVSSIRFMAGDPDLFCYSHNVKLWL